MIEQQGKIPGREHRQTRSAHNLPDTAHPEKVVFPEIAIAVTSTKPVPIAGNEGYEPCESTRRDWEDIVKYAPVQAMPLTRHNEIKPGGGRTIGGGTSKDALRRAKKQERRRRRM